MVYDFLSAYLSVLSNMLGPQYERDDALPQEIIADLLKQKSVIFIIKI